jgi:hypothetical protein
MAMKRVIALVLAGAMSLAAVPAFAQQSTNSQTGQNGDQTTNPQHVDSTGLNALGQAPPPNGFTNNQLLIGGLALGGLGGIIALVVSNNNNNNNNPVSP